MTRLLILIVHRVNIKHTKQLLSLPTLQPLFLQIEKEQFSLLLKELEKKKDGVVIIPLVSVGELKTPKTLLF